MKPGLSLAALLISTAAFAQSSQPGPYIVDIRGAMSGAPSGISFYPPVPTDTTAPQRAFGFGLGGHVYPFGLGIARVGFGADLLRTRGTATSGSAVKAAMTVTTIAPQLSFNFGTRDGWSYLSGGYGMTQTRAEISAPAGVIMPNSPSSRDRRTGAINVGGGARWFVRERFAVGFDARFHRLGTTDGTSSRQIFGLSVGVSLR